MSIRLENAGQTGTDEGQQIGFHGDDQAVVSQRPEERDGLLHQRFGQLARLGGLEHCQAVERTGVNDQASEIGIFARQPTTVAEGLLETLARFSHPTDIAPQHTESSQPFGNHASRVSNLFTSRLLWRVGQRFERRNGLFVGTNGVRLRANLVQ